MGGIKDGEDEIISTVTNSVWIKKTVLFLAGQMVSLFGSSLVQFAIIWQITLSTSSGVMMTIATVCSFLPQIIIAPFGGVWADRYNRKALIMLADGIIAISTLVLAIIYLSGYRELWLIFVVSGIRSFGSGVQTPAVNALLPQIVPKEKLLRVNSISASAQSVILLASPAASGAILSLVGLEATFFVDVITAAVAIVIMLFLKVAIHERATRAQTTGHFDDLKEGIHYVLGNSFVRYLILIYAIYMFMVVPAAFLTPLMVERDFDGEVWRLTANEMLYSLGTAFGGIIIAVWGGFKNRIITIAAAMLIFGVMTAAIGFSTSFIIFLILIFAAGIASPMLNAPSISLLQEFTEPSMHGRVFSIIQIISSTMLPLGMIIFGPLADIVNVRILMIISGIFISILSVVVFLKRKVIKNI